MLNISRALSDRTRRKIPLIIVVPHNVQDSLFLKSLYVRNLDQLETDHAFVDQHGFALVRIQAFGKDYSAQKTDNEIALVINRLQSEYDIDARNIFLMGACEGGRRALVQLALSPDRYAGADFFSIIRIASRTSITEYPPFK